MYKGGWFFFPGYHIQNRWVIIWPAPPPKLWPRITPTTRSFFIFTGGISHFFGIKIFVFFWDKTLNLWIYTTTSCFMKIDQKVDLPLEITFCFLFFKKHKVVPFGFFQISIKIQIEPFSGSTFWCFFGKKLQIFELPYFILFYQKYSKSGFYLKSNKVVH